MKKHPGNKEVLTGLSQKTGRFLALPRSSSEILNIQANKLMSSFAFAHQLLGSCFSSPPLNISCLKVHLFSALHPSRRQLAVRTANIGHFLRNSSAASRLRPR